MKRLTTTEEREAARMQVIRRFHDSEVTPQYPEDLSSVARLRDVAVDLQCLVNEAKGIILRLKDGRPTPEADGWLKEVERP